ncbi:hypothetical protein ANN_08032 [Periplaneta americana]|uniref:Transposase n=1 Tax=Periplaneta americana TaxID=6978 RepID=A0ABQ8T097_PERAM|nr:hypothetical protein ANN_08032 [Periplaneta americana]
MRIERNSKSVRCLSRQLQIPKSTVFKVLKFTLKKRAYHLQVLHQLHEEDLAERMAMCIDLLDSVETDGLMSHVLFSDEATFHVSGQVNRHYCRIWADKPPMDFIEHVRDSPKTNVWLGITQTKIYRQK